MTKKILSFFMNILIVLAIAAIGFAQSSVPKIGGILPDMELVKSKD